VDWLLSRASVWLVRLRHARTKRDWGRMRLAAPQSAVWRQLWRHVMPYDTDTLLKFAVSGVFFTRHRFGLLTSIANHVAVSFGGRIMNYSSYMRARPRFSPTPRWKHSTCRDRTNKPPSSFGFWIRETGGWKRGCETCEQNGTGLFTDTLITIRLVRLSSGAHLLMIRRQSILWVTGLHPQAFPVRAAAHHCLPINTHVNTVVRTILHLVLWLREPQTPPQPRSSSANSTCFFEWQIRFCPIVLVSGILRQVRVASPARLFSQSARGSVSRSSRFG